MSILTVIGQEVELRRAGRRWIGHCPFHDDPDGSFSVNEPAGLFYCFGCGAKGTADDFTDKLAERRGLS
jgi:DNA primase